MKQTNEMNESGSNWEEMKIMFMIFSCISSQQDGQKLDAAQSIEFSTDFRIWKVGEISLKSTKFAFFQGGGSFSESEAAYKV